MNAHQGQVKDRPHRKGIGVDFMKVLWVEDHAPVRDMLAIAADKAARSRVQVDLVMAPTLMAAETRLRLERFDLVVLDLGLPDMNGHEVLRQLRLARIETPILILSGDDDTESKLKGFGFGADDYLTKPFDTEELLIRLKNLVDLRKKMQEHFGTEDILKPKKIKMSSMDTVFMEKVTEHLETEISNSLFGVIELASTIGLSQSQLLRKIKAITGQTPNEFIRSFRLHRAMEMLQQQAGTVSEIAYETGFQNASYFAKSFQKQFGMAPSAVKQK